MKKLKNKQWFDRHAKLKHEKKLRRQITYVQIPNPSKEYLVLSPKAARRFEQNLSNNQYDTLVAPQNFSLYSNPDETLAFISKIEDKVLDGRPVFFDMQPIEILTIDTIMYFLATLKKMKLSGIRYSCNGSLPSNHECKALLVSSGFLDYVRSRRTDSDMAHDSLVVKILTGQKADPSAAKTVCCFAMEKLGLDRTEIRNLYNIIIELMLNTKQHAYIHRDWSPITDWYIFVHHIQAKNVVRFIFLDSGAGIPVTIKKKGWEFAAAAVGFGSDTAYIKSALAGNFRSRSGLPYRGKGLPKIDSFYRRGYIKDLTIMSNQGYFSNDNDSDINQTLRGTLFYWELSQEN